MRRGSVRVRLTLWNVAVVALVLVGFSVTLHYLARLNLTRSLDQQLDRRLNWERGIAESLLSHGSLRGKKGVKESRPPKQRGKSGSSEAPKAAATKTALVASGPQLEEELQRPGWFDKTGRPVNPLSVPQPFSRGALARSAAGDDVRETIVYRGRPVRLRSAPARSQGAIVAIIQVVGSLEGVETMTRGLDHLLLILALPALVAVGLAGAFLTRRGLEPVRQFSDATAELGTKDLSRRLPVSGGDEFTELALRFNSMAERLEAAFASLQATNRSLEETNRALQAAYERQRRFTADASHELRTPLAEAKTTTSVALCTEGTTDDYRDALRVVDRSLDSMGRLIQDLLLLARSDAGQLDLRAASSELRWVLGRAAELAAKELGDRFDWEKPAVSLIVRGDGEHLVRLFRNLLENAARHTPEDGRISLEARSEGDRVTVEVVDTGPGIAPEHLPHLGERFYRVDPSRTRSQGGVGLGLSICQSIAAACGGDLEVESHMGRGTTVRVTLPVA